MIGGRAGMPSRAGTGTSAMALTAVLIASPAHGAEADAADLFAAITLAGNPCERVVGVETTDDGAQIASCASGHNYRVTIDAEDRVTVVNLAGQARAGVPDHRAYVQRHLFSIINLSGFVCDSVVNSERPSRLAYDVRCGNGSSYEIRAGSDGRITVRRR